MSKKEYAVHCVTANDGAKKWTEVIQMMSQMNPRSGNAQAWISKNFVPWESQSAFIDSQGGAVIYFDASTNECTGWNGLRDHIRLYTGYQSVTADEFLTLFGKSSCKISIADMLSLL